MGAWLLRVKGFAQSDRGAQIEAGEVQRHGEGRIGIEAADYVSSLEPGSWRLSPATLPSALHTIGVAASRRSIALALIEGRCPMTTSSMVGVDLRVVDIAVEAARFREAVAVVSHLNARVHLRCGGLGIVLGEGLAIDDRTRYSALLTRRV